MDYTQETVYPIYATVRLGQVVKEFVLLLRGMLHKVINLIQSYHKKSPTHCCAGTPTFGDFCAEF